MVVFRMNANVCVNALCLFAQFGCINTIAFIFPIAPVRLMIHRKHPPGFKFVIAFFICSDSSVSASCLEKGFKILLKQAVQDWIGLGLYLPEITLFWSLLI